MAIQQQIVIDVRFDADGVLDTAHVLNQLESRLEGHLKVTDWIDERLVAQDYPHLTSEQRLDVISLVQGGDYDDGIINKDARRYYLDEMVGRAGYETETYESDHAAP